MLDLPLTVDNFAGGGGASSGIEAGLGRPIDYAINHDPEAIAMHRANHPRTHHLVTNVMDVDPVRLARGRRIGLAWFSPDCTFHSKARGGKPFRDRDVARRRRGLAWSVTTWAKLARPEVIMLENVEEFADWGPLNKDGSICQLRRGMTFRRWVRMLQNLGYAVDMREMIACEYGAPTTRKRLFIIARRDGQEIVFPEATHGHGRQPFRTAADCIDFSRPCPSIFDRARPLAPATMRRIYRGLMRYVVNTGNPFIVPITHTGGVRVHGIDEPLRTITTAQRGEFALVAPTMVQTGWGEREGQAPRCLDLGKPLGTIMAEGNKHALVAAFLAQHNTGVIGHRADEPVSTITSRGTQQQLVTAHLMTNTTGHAGASADSQVPTITTGNQQALVSSHLLQLRRNCDGRDVTEPLRTISAGGTHHAEVRAFLMSYYGTDQAPDLRGPAPTVRTHEHLGLVLVHGQPYQIVDIGMRMLAPRELYRAQGFRDEYIIDHGVDEDGDALPLTKTAQVRMCGNSVAPPVAEALVRANVVDEREQAAA